ncbi:hypothetical protein CPLU01_00767 [Colletotrichum plurivorum]|uniref:Uncharacterized protein n=1 Tax=Colletotrichum plurivorum TaxID=2175906 RepID=A0A8H6U5S2_9PEZI|nr:hypothetical protein CPLU01_00767 [Colletotrichum plurivorum]
MNFRKWRPRHDNDNSKASEPLDVGGHGNSGHHHHRHHRADRRPRGRSPHRRPRSDSRGGGGIITREDLPDIFSTDM